MSAKSFCYFLLLTLTAVLPARAQQRKEPDQVRDAFLITRDAKLISQNNKPTLKPARKKSLSNLPSALGLGYTVFKKGSEGNPIRVSPDQVFHEGDGVRFMIESNTTGYLYIFTTENDGSPQMIYPDARLNDGTNRIKAHVPREIPSRNDPWFIFNERPATERFYLAMTRQPLADIKIGKTLVAAYQKNPMDHPWQLTTEVWKGLLAQAGESRISKGREFGATQTQAEQIAVVRGVKLDAADTAPSVVVMNTSPKSGMLMAQITLSHK